MITIIIIIIKKKSYCFALEDNITAEVVRK